MDELDRGNYVMDEKRIFDRFFCNVNDRHLSIGSNRMFSNSVFDIDGKFRKNESVKRKSRFLLSF